MADEFNINNPSQDQILIYDVAQQAFINVEPTLSIFGAISPITGGMNLGTEGEGVFNNIGSNTMRFKRIRGKDGVVVTGAGSYIDIAFDGDATTLQGLGRSGFLEKSNNLSDVNPLTARNNLGVYSAAQTDNRYMFSNDTNLPDVDATYDLGSNGRRYADIYAVTFHGLATESVKAQTLTRNNATDGEVLTWIEGEGWVPRESRANLLSELSDVSLNNLQHESLLIYNGVRNVWESAPLSVLGNIGGGGTGGTIFDAENVGGGIGTYFTRFGGNLQFRSIRAGSNVSVTTNFNNEEIVISADVPTTTDQLPEGTNNRYFTSQRVRDTLLTVSIQDLGSTDNNPPSQGTAPVWDGTTWMFRTVAVDINTTDDLPEGSSNRYYRQDRVFTDIGEYLVDVNYGITLNELKDVDAANTSGHFLHFNGNEWTNKSITVSDISNVNLSGLSNNSILRYSTATNNFVVGTLPTVLFDLGQTSDSLHFNQASFDAFFATKTTDNLTETPSRRYLNNTNLVNALGSVSIGALSDVDLTGVANNNVLVWNSALNRLVPADSSSLNVTVSMGLGELNNVSEASVTNAQEGQVLAFNQANNEFEMRTLSQTLSNLTDVDTQGVTLGDTIVFDGSGFGVAKLMPYSDSNGLNEGDILRYSVASQKFEVVSGSAIGVENLNDLDDVTIDSPQNNHVVTYDIALNRFINKDVSDFIELSSLSDVAFNTLSTNDMITYNGAQFVNTPNLLHGVSAPQDGQVLVYEQATNSFVSADVGSVTGVNPSGAQLGDVLLYNSTTSQFEPVSIGIGNLNDVVDYNAVDQSINVLRWDSSQNTYQIQNIEQTLSIGDLFDVDLTGIDNQYVLVYNLASGSFEAAPAPASIELISQLLDVDETVTPQNNDVLTFNAATSKYEPKAPVPATQGTSVYEFVSTNNQTTFQLEHDGDALVFANGILLPNSEVDLQSSDSEITLNTPRALGDVVRVLVVHDPAASQTNINASVVNAVNDEFVMTSGQDEIIFDHSGIVMVYANGILLPTSQVDANDLTRITLTTPRNAGDVIRIVDFVQV